MSELERLNRIEERLARLEDKLEALSRREKRLTNLVLRLAATGMVLSEVLQKSKMIRAADFEKRAGAFLKTLDQEISEKKTGLYLDNLLKKFEEEAE